MSAVGIDKPLMFEAGTAESRHPARRIGVAREPSKSDLRLCDESHALRLNHSVSRHLACAAGLPRSPFRLQPSSPCRCRDEQTPQNFRNGLALPDAPFAPGSPF